MTVVLAIAGTLCVLFWLGMLNTSGGRGSLFDRVMEHNADLGAPVNHISEQTGPYQSRTMSWDTSRIKSPHLIDALYDELSENDRDRRFNG